MRLDADICDYRSQMRSQITTCNGLVSSVKTPDCRPAVHHLHLHLTKCVHAENAYYPWRHKNSFQTLLQMHTNTLVYAQMQLEVVPEEIKP